MHKVSTVYYIEDPIELDYKFIHKSISDKWEKKARELQKRRWQTIKRLSRNGKIQ